MTSNSPSTASETPSPKNRKRVVVAMSGGVDSSVVAAMMAKAGHDVIGITLQLYDHGEATARKGSCCAGQDIHDARRVAERLGIPHYVLDYEERFSSAVIDTFADSYLAGETPIPCVNCNTQIKFKDLLATAQELGADVLATGHYIRRADTPSGPMLARAVDADRDQSYFLFGTTREQLEHLWFPLGDMRKDEVRDVARALDLSVADKADSQDICFVPTGRYTDIIERLKPGAMHPGKIVHVDGRVLGEHQGIVNYTIGQRRGLKIACGEPLYVIKLNSANNEVLVGPREYLQTETLRLREVNWLGQTPLGDLPKHGQPIHVRVRSTQAPQPALLFADTAGAISVTLDEFAEGVAAGQACVFYSNGDGDAVILGGGWIDSTGPSSHLCDQTEPSTTPKNGDPARHATNH